MSDDKLMQFVGAIDLEQHIPYLLGVLSNTIRQSSSETLARKSGISAREIRVIGMIALKGPITSARTAELTGMDRATITRAMKILMQHGFAEKRPNKDDGRSQLLYLTEKGVEICQKYIPYALKTELYYRAVLSDDEFEVFLDILGRLQKKAEYLLDKDLDELPN